MLSLYATKAGWYSYEDPDGRNGVFTRLLLEGLGGQAGQTPGAAGSVTFADLAAWLPGASTRYSLDLGLRQQAVAVGNASPLGAAMAWRNGSPAAQPATPALSSPVGKLPAEYASLSLSAKIAQGARELERAVSQAARGNIAESIRSAKLAMALDPDLCWADGVLPRPLIDVYSRRADHLLWEKPDLSAALDMAMELYAAFPSTPRVCWIMGTASSMLSRKNAASFFLEMERLPREYEPETYFHMDMYAFLARLSPDRSIAVQYYEKALLYAVQLGNQPYIYVEYTDLLMQRSGGDDKIRELLDQAEKALAQAPQMTVEVMHRQFLFALRTRDTAKARKLAAAINKHPQISLYSYVLDDLKAKGY
jgi:tetratricopeptide (TPR) repeat protein